MADSSDHVRPCNDRHGGYFCANPEGHAGTHTSCGGVEWPSEGAAKDAADRGHVAPLRGETRGRA